MPPKAQKAAAAPAKPAAEVKPIKSSTVTAEIIESVLEHVNVSAPHAEYVYVNNKGEFHLHPRSGFVKVDATTGDVITEVVHRERKMMVKNYAPAAEPEATEDDDAAPINDGKEF